jgi:hypothetical protein
LDSKNSVAKKANAIAAPLRNPVNIQKIVFMATASEQTV